MFGDPYLITMVLSRTEKPSWYQVSEVGTGQPIDLNRYEKELMRKLAHSLRKRQAKFANISEGESHDAMLHVPLRKKIG
jgi:hypothetical protein